MKVACIQLSTGENYNKNCNDIIKYIIEAIKKDIEEQKNVDKEVIEIFINLFFEINKKINNSKTFELDSVQIINTVEYIFIKKSEQLKKYKNG